MLKTLFENQRKYLDHFFESVDCDQIEKLLNKLTDCKGVVVFSGVGKSGHIAEKITATFLSTGTRAFFLSPVNALHGDIGFISPGDLFICFSKSGGSSELLDLLPFIKKRGAYTVAVCSTPDSRLSKLADFSVLLPIEKEICPFDLAPTTSTVVQLIFGDCLAVALMQARKFTIKDFAANHPGGVLGRKITFRVADLMLKGDDVPFCKPTDRLIDVLHELSQKRCGCLVVADEEKNLKGIFTDGDLRRAIQVNGAETLNMTLSMLMTPMPKSVSSHKMAFEAVKAMEEDPSHLITVLPVLDSNQVVGLVRMHDIIQKELS